MSSSAEVKKHVGVLESFDGTPIYFEERGEGEAIVFVYGIACLMNHWHYQIEYFSRGYKTLAFDLRGHQKSQPLVNFENLRIEDLAKDLTLLLEKQGIRKAHFIGHSFGAPVILKLYEMTPSVFHTITFINGFSQNPIKNMFGLGVVDKVFYFVKNQYEVAPEMWNKLWKASVDNPISMLLAGAAGGFNLQTVNLKDVEIYAHGVAQMDLRVFLKLFEELMNFNGDHILPEIQVPTLIISGGKDNVTPQSFQKKFHEKIPASEYLFVPYGSHCTQLDFPEFTNLKIEDFIERMMFRK